MPYDTFGVYFYFLPNFDQTVGQFRKITAMMNHLDQETYQYLFHSREFALRKKKTSAVAWLATECAQAKEKQEQRRKNEKKNLISIVSIDCSKVWNCRINAIFELDVWQRERRAVAVLCVRGQPSPKDNQQVSLSRSLFCTRSPLKEQTKPMAILIPRIIWPRKRANELKSMHIQ